MKSCLTYSKSSTYDEYMTIPVSENVIFQLPDNVQEAFTFGDCWHLAQTINRLSGYPVVTVQWEEPHRSLWCHAANRLPDGRIVDIEGIWEEEEWLWKWQVHNELHVELDVLVMFAQEWTPESWAQEVAECDFDFYYPEISENVEQYAKQVLALSAS